LGNCVQSCDWSSCIQRCAVRKLDIFRVDAGLTSWSIPWDIMVAPISYHVGCASHRFNYNCTKVVIRRVDKRYCQAFKQARLRTKRKFSASKAYTKSVQLTSRLSTSNEINFKWNGAYREEPARLLSKTISSPIKVVSVALRVFGVCRERMRGLSYHQQHIFISTFVLVQYTDFTPLVTV
jgi:hypothetical protein